MGATIRTDRQGRPILLYTYRGDIEVGARYTWRRGYSLTTADGRILYPWMTKTMCQRNAKQLGGVARFHETPNADAELKG